ncbi:hypothetical protein BURPS305_3990 [Burkholderia pseudomallei 305]|nr:hypothetical protein BURPS305_3990 [Burkholderia pseudomallei 305]
MNDSSSAARDWLRELLISISVPRHRLGYTLISLIVISFTIRKS